MNKKISKLVVLTAMVAMCSGNVATYATEVQNLNSKSEVTSGQSKASFPNSNVDVYGKVNKSEKVENLSARHAQELTVKTDGNITVKINYRNGKSDSFKLSGSKDKWGSKTLDVKAKIGANDLWDYHVTIEGTGSYKLENRTYKYDDIEGHWAQESIERLSSMGGIDGGQKEFRPNDSVTRAEFVKILNSALIMSGGTTESFTDVDKNDWFYNDVCIAVKNGYITSNNKEFRPNDTITREEVATMVTSVMGGKDTKIDKLLKYNDHKQVSSWAKTSVEGAIEKGFMGQGSNNFRPKANITRAEAVVVALRALNDLEGSV